MYRDNQTIFIFTGKVAIQVNSYIWINIHPQVIKCWKWKVVYSLTSSLNTRSSINSLDIVVHSLACPFMRQESPKLSPLLMKFTVLDSVASGSNVDITAESTKKRSNVCSQYIPGPPTPYLNGILDKEALIYVAKKTWSTWKLTHSYR